MIFSRLNLRSALIRERGFQQRLVNEANELLRNATAQDEDIFARLRKSNNKTTVFTYEERSNVFSLEEIKSICIRYRLRFLDSSLFKAEYPYEAVLAIKLFEKNKGIKIQSFKILAPSKAFELENINKDPLLFAQLNNNSFYLIHQWGHDLAWYRRFLTWPLQNFKTLMIFLIIICALFAFSIPSSIMHIFTLQSEIYLRIWLTVHTFIGLLGFSLWGGLSFNKTFSKLNWDSKYYNY